MIDISFHFHLKKEGETLIDTLPIELKKIINDLPSNELNINKIIKNKNKKYRVIIETNEKYTLKFISSDKDHLKSKKLSQSDADSIIARNKKIDEIISKERKNISENFSKFTHNLKTLCTMSIQDIELFSPMGSTDDFNISKLKDWSIFISELESSEKIELAKTLMRIYKNMQHTQNDITVYEYLFNNVPVKTKITDHSIHKLITRSVLCCASLLLEKGVTIKFGEADWPVQIDYASTQVALFYVMDNIIKYIKPNTDLVISFVYEKARKKTIVTFKMESLFVSKNEENRIFDEGYSGKQAIDCNMNGKGLGMFTAKKLLNENKANIRFLTKGVSSDLFLNRKYSENEITLEFS